MAAVAIWMLIAFGVLTFGVRVGIQLRRTGSTGLIGLRQGAGAADWLSGFLFLGGMAMEVGSIVLVLGDHLRMIEALDADGLHVAGIVLAAAGGTAVFAAQLGMGESWRIGVSDDQRTDLVTGGWFSICRNPIYSAMVIGWAGFALLVPTWLGLAAVIAIVVALELQVRAVEEPYLLSTHGEHYRAYVARVGRFVPRVGRRS